MENGHQTPLDKAIEICGSQTALAKRAGCTQQNISRYHTNPKLKIPAELAVKIEQATGGNVPRWEVRPDLFTEPPKPKSSLMNFFSASTS